jgi:hypothetical protein
VTATEAAPGDGPAPPSGGGEGPARPAVEVLRGDTPTDEELAAILAAYEALWPKPALVDGGRPEAETPRWRFSGRWWTKPVALRRERPGGIRG